MNKRRPIARVALILQTSPAENAAAALAMVLSYHHEAVSVGELMERPMVSAADLMTAAQQRGIHAQGYQMTFDQLTKAPMPLIAHWKFRSFVVVTGIRGSCVYINSPEEGRLVLKRRDFEAGFTGVAICFAQGEQQTEQQESVSAPQPERSAAPVLLSAQFLITVLCLVLAVLSREVAARLSAPQTGGGLSMCLGLGGAVLLLGAAGAVQIAVLRHACRVDCRRENGSFAAFLAGETAAFFEKSSPYRLDAAARACKDLPAARAQAAACWFQLAGGAACLVVVALQNLLAGTMAALVAAAFAAICWQGRERIYSEWQVADRERFFATELAAEDLETPETIRLRGETQEHFRRWFDRAGCLERPATVADQKRLWHIAAAVQMLAVLLASLAGIAAGWAGTADLIGCAVLSAGAAAAMGALPQLIQAQALRRWLTESAQALSGHREGREESVPNVGAVETLTLQNVSLRRADREPPIARGITFTLHRGEILVVAGGETLRRVMAPVAAGLERPWQGEIYLGNTALSDMGEKEICKNITLLGRGLPFPGGTVRQNIAAGFPNITDYAVTEAASAALLHESILQRKRGYDTPAATLSEGEQVLLEFACAFARGTPFLVCDSLTGRLDRDTEGRLLHALHRRGVGTVLLTGDAALLRRGDLACRIQEGQVTLRERSELIDEEVYSLV